MNKQGLILRDIWKFSLKKEKLSLLAAYGVCGKKFMFIWTVKGNQKRSYALSFHYNVPKELGCELFKSSSLKFEKK